MQTDMTLSRILIVEDQQKDFIKLTEYLKENIPNPKITHLKNFTEAKDTIEKNDIAFDIVLLDLSMPDIPKEVLIKEVKAFTAILPVIILTGYSDLEFATKSLNAGVSDYLVKDILTPFVLYKSLLYSLERYRFIHSLKSSENRYMNLFHLSPCPMWVYDLDSLSFLDVNEAAISHYGYSKNEFLSMSVKDIKLEEDIPLLEEAIKKVKNKMVFNSKNIYRHKKKDATVIDVEISSSLIKYNNTWGEIVLATDITQKLSQIRAIQEQNKRLREIAWTQSHVVRAPVSRLMGIIDLLKNENLIETEKDEMMDHLFSSAEEIDQIIKEIVNKSQQLNHIEDD